MKKKARLAAGNTADKPKKNKASGLIYRTGNNRILLIAPHGHKNNEPGTAEIAKYVQRIFGCSAILNTEVPKTVLNYNRIDQAETDTDYIDALRNPAAADGHTLAVFVHGIDDASIKAEAERLGVGNGALKVVVGYGQPDKMCARKETAKAFVKALTDNGLCAAEAFEVTDGYCAAHWNVMPQWFNKNKLDDFNNVEALQIELKGKGVRDTDSREQTAINLARALSEVTGLPLAEAVIVQPEAEADAALVEIVHAKLRDIVGSAAQDMMAREQNAALEAGKYLIEVFYDNDYELAEAGKMTRKASFRALENRLKSGKAERPKKSWLHNAVKVAVAERWFSTVEDKDAVQTYGQLTWYPPGRGSGVSPRLPADPSWSSNPKKKSGANKEPPTAHFNRNDSSQVLIKNSLPLSWTCQFHGSKVPHPEAHGSCWP